MTFQMPIPLLKHILTSLLALITLSATAVNLQPYKFNGKEHDAVHGLDLLDYGARMYDNKTGRWTSVDPLAEDYYHVSPYAYCLNNPVKFVDPDGNYVESIWDIASFSFGFASLIEDINEKNYENALWDAGGMVLDGLAIIIPGVPGGAGAAIKAERVAEKVGMGKKLSNMKRGRESEARVLKDMGLKKNTQKVGKYNNPRVIPDAIDDNNFYEIKDVKYLPFSKQIKHEYNYGKDSEKNLKIIIGNKTKTSKNIPKDVTFIRREDLGP